MKFRKVIIVVCMTCVVCLFLYYGLIKPAAASYGFENGELVPLNQMGKQLNCVCKCTEKTQ